MELSGGNDGLNTIVPHGDDAYYRHRPTLGIRRDDLLPLDEHFGFNPGMLGLQRLWERGDLAIVHGCGYEDPSFSHFTSMAYWHTAAPNGGDDYGWVGRLADVMSPVGAAEHHRQHRLRPVARREKPTAYAGRLRRPGTFRAPRPAHRNASSSIRCRRHSTIGNPTRRYLRDVARSAHDAAGLVRQAIADYQTDIDYGIAPLDLDKVAACIAAELPTRIYYVSFRNNAFDTHVQQANLHQRLLSYAL